MNDYQNNTVGEIRRAAIFKTEQSAFISEDTLLSEIFTDVYGKHGMCELTLCEMDMCLKKPKQLLDEAVDELFEMGDRFALLAKSYGEYKDVADFSNLTGCRKYELERISIDRAITRCRKLIEVLDLNAEATTAAKITDEEKMAFLAKLDEVIKLEAGPAKARKHHKQLNDYLNKTLKEYVRLRDKILKPYLEGKYKKTVFYKDFLTILNQKADAPRKRAITGRFTDVEGNPIRRVRVIIDGEAPRILGSMSGHFYINRLEYGEHTIVFMRKSYKNVEVKVVVHPDMTIELNVVFESIEVGVS